jgi:acid phosphatase type 7
MEMEIFRNRDILQKLDDRVMPILLLLLLIFGHEFTLAQASLIRGPYLNMGSTNGVVVKWRTSISEIGQVRYGFSPDRLIFEASELQAGTDHEIRLSGLVPSATYYYTIGTSSSIYVDSDGSYYFKTSPFSKSKQPVRIWAIGDFGTGTQSQRAVRNAYVKHYSDRHTDIWMWLGDNAYSYGKDTEYQEHVFQIYPDELKHMIVWPTPGNHDYMSIDSLKNGPYFDVFTLPTQGEAGGVPSGSEQYYSFNYGNIHFVSIDTEDLPLINSDSTALFKWLEKDLAENKSEWLIAFWHHAPYSKGTHNSDRTDGRMEFSRRHINPILERYGCDLVLAGHSHTYERSYFINGHYGKSQTFQPALHLIDGSNGNPDEGNTYLKISDSTLSSKGTVYVVSGTGGALGSSEPSPLNHPAMYMSTESYHGSLVIDVDGSFMKVRFIDTTGAVIDQFAIQKQSGLVTNVESYSGLIQLNAYPNPFKTGFTVEFSLEKEEKLSLEIKDIQGRVVEKLEEGIYPAGVHKLEFTPGAGMSAGVYLIEVKAADKLGAKRMLRME